MTDSAAPRPDFHLLLERAIEEIGKLDLDDFTPVEPAEEIPSVEPPEGPPTRDELRRLTIMFSDLAGSTALSGALDPESYRQLLETYMATCREAITEFGGHLVQTRGDGLLAVFGYPVPHDDDPDRAVRAGLRIHEQLEARARDSRRSESPLEARVGIHRGLVYLDQGSGDPYGLAVNLAARIQEVADTGSVVISGEVRDLLRDNIRTRELPTRPMKGVTAVPEVHEVIGATGDTAGPRRWSTPLVGRDASLRRILDRLGAVTGGDIDGPVAVTVVGDAGIGKSRLVTAVLDELAGRGAPDPVWIAGSPRRRGGLQPIRDLLWGMAGIERDADPVDQLARLRSLLTERGMPELVALLAPVAGIPPSAGYEPVSSDQRKLEGEILDAVHRLLTDRFRRGGVLVVEDHHWLDEKSAAVIDRLVRQGPVGLAVLSTSRDTARRWNDRVTVEVLDALDPVAAAELARHLHPDADRDAIDAVLATADGVPLFIEELVRARNDAGTPAAAAADSPIPGVLYETLYARLGALGDERIVVSAAATLGRVVDLEVLAEVSDCAADLLDRAVATLIRQRVLDPDHGDGRTVRFRHELVRLVAYELEPPSGRARLHARAATVLSGRAGSRDWLRIADHRRIGGDPWGAVVALEHAAEDARRRGSQDEARAIFDRALEILGEAEHDPARDRREVAIRLNRAFLAVSTEGFGSEHAADDYRRCLELSLADPVSESMYRTLIGLWGYCVNRADFDDAWSVSTALHALSKGPRAALAPTYEAGLGMIEWFRGSFVGAARWLDAAVADIDQLAVDDDSAPSAWTMPLDPLASMYIHHALARFWLGDIETAATSFRAARDRCRALPFPAGPFTDVYVILLGTWMDVARDDPAAALAAADEAAEIAARHGFEAWSTWAVAARRALGAWADPDGDVLAAQAEAEAYVALWHALGVYNVSGSVRAVLARGLLAGGYVDEARAVADAALDWARQTGATAFDADIRHTRALTEPESTRAEALGEALDLAEAQGAVLTAVRAAADLVRLDAPGANERLAAALARIPTGVDLPVVAAARAAMAGG